VDSVKDQLLHRKYLQVLKSTIERKVIDELEVRGLEVLVELAQFLGESDHIFVRARDGRVQTLSTNSHSPTNVQLLGIVLDELDRLSLPFLGPKRSDVLIKQTDGDFISLLVGVALDHRGIGEPTAQRLALVTHFLALTHEEMLVNFTPLKSTSPKRINRFY